MPLMSGWFMDHSSFAFLSIEAIRISLFDHAASFRPSFSGVVCPVWIRHRSTASRRASVATMARFLAERLGSAQHVFPSQQRKIIRLKASQQPRQFHQHRAQSPIPAFVHRQVHELAGGTDDAGAQACVTGYLAAVGEPLPVANLRLGSWPCSTRRCPSEANPWPLCGFHCAGSAAGSSVPRAFRVTAISRS